MAIGVILLIRESWFWVDWEEFWPVVLIVVGLLLIFRRSRKREDHEAPTASVSHQPNNAHKEGTIS